MQHIWSFSLVHLNVNMETCAKHIYKIWEEKSTQLKSHVHKLTWMIDNMTHVWHELCQAQADLHWKAWAGWWWWFCHCCPDRDTAHSPPSSTPTILPTCQTAPLATISFCLIFKTKKKQLFRSTTSTPRITSQCTVTQSCMLTADPDLTRGNSFCKDSEFTSTSCLHVNIRIKK